MAEALGGSQINKREEGIGFGSSIGQVDQDWSVVVRRSRSKHDMRPSVGYVGSATDTPINAVQDHVDTGVWERIPLKIDSGAVDTVMPPGVAQYFPLTSTEASRQGRGFVAANGTPITNYGARVIKGLDDSWGPINLTAQIADVKSTLASVHQIVKAGNRVHFEKGNSYVQNIRTGKKTTIQERAGTFEVGVWVPRVQAAKHNANSSVHSMVNNPVKLQNKYAVLEAGEHPDDLEDQRHTKMMGFAGQDDF